MVSDPAVNEFLKNYSPVDVETDASWRAGEIELTISAYITCDEPPPVLVTSVRALVFRDESILLMQNVNGPHIFPGGRVEAGESHLKPSGGSSWKRRVWRSPTYAGWASCICVMRHRSRLTIRTSTPISSGPFSGRNTTAIARRYKNLTTTSYHRSSFLLPTLTARNSPPRSWPT